MKIVLDTNVFISGIFFSGPPSRILKAWAGQRLQIVLSRQILDEYQRVAQTLAAKFQTIDIVPIIDLVTIHADNLSIPREPTLGFARTLTTINSSSVRLPAGAIQ